MKYKDMFKTWWYWTTLLVFVAIHSYMVYLDYGKIGLIEIIASFIFNFIIFWVLFSIFWLLAYGMKKTFNRKGNP